jgi:hypothetical protein
MFGEVTQTPMTPMGLLRGYPSQVPPCNNPRTRAQPRHSLATQLRLPLTHTTKDPRQHLLTRARSHRTLSTEEEASRPRHHRKGMSQPTTSPVRCPVLALPPLLPTPQQCPMQQVAAIVTEKPTDTPPTGTSALPGVKLKLNCNSGSSRTSSTGCHLDASCVSCWKLQPQPEHN